MRSLTLWMVHESRDNVHMGVSLVYVLRATRTQGGDLADQDLR